MLGVIAWGAEGGRLSTVQLQRENCGGTRSTVRNTSATSENDCEHKEQTGEAIIQAERLSAVQDNSSVA